MTHETSSIDDLLHPGKSLTQPAAPENNYVEPEPIPEAQEEVAQAEEVEPSKIYELNEEPEQEADTARPELEHDDYGNEKAASKTYTEDEVNERINQAIRDRLSRLERNTSQQQPNQAQVQQATQQGFEYNAESPESWQQQLESFVEHTVNRMSEKQARQAYEQREQQAQAEFETKFRSGMSRFNDYAQVVATQPITDAMTMASRAMKDPAAFFYAAAKRAPQELQRIANIPDQYAQMVEIGKLEERMRQTKQATKAPKPISKVQEDSSIPHKAKQTEPSIEQLIAQDAAKRKALQDSRRRR